MRNKEDTICRNCAHYRRHYILHKDRATAVNCGHCVAARIKNRKPDDAACENYESFDHTTDLPGRQEVIDYLSTDFLKWVQEKVLPPVVEKDEGSDEIEEATGF